MGIVFESPASLLFLCLLAGALYAFFLYFFQNKQNQEPVFRWIMAVLRFVAVTLIAMLILSPLIRRNMTTVEKPVVIIGVDNSASILLANDSGFYKTRLVKNLNKLVSTLAGKYDVKTYSFGEKLSEGILGTFREKETDISSFFKEVEDRYINRNTGALILVTDGIFNKGIDPFYSSRKISFPIFCVSLGDTTHKKDAFLSRVAVNKTAFKGDKFPVEIYTGISGYPGKLTTVSLSREGKNLYTSEIKANGENAIEKTTFFVEPEKTGNLRYTVVVKPMDEELNARNNKQDFFVEVLEARQKIAIVYDAPHPDITAILMALEGSARFEVENITPDNFPSSFEKYDLIILVQVPSASGTLNLSPVMKSHASLLFIIGSRSDLNGFNNLKTGTTVNAGKQGYTEAQPIANEDFSLFSQNKKEKTIFQDFPPLLAPLTVFQTGLLTEVLFYQKIGTVTTTNPLILFSRSTGRKTGIIAGENIWRWRIANYFQQSDHAAFDDLINKIIHFLAVKEDKDFFRIKIGTRLSENEPVEMEAELYNSSYELVNEPDVNVVITGQEQKNYPLTFSRSEHAYYLNAGILPVGNYTYVASVSLGKTNFQKRGSFFIEQINKEFFRLTADHQLLHRIAETHGGEMVYPADIEKIGDKINSRDDIRSVSIIEKKFTGLVGNPWLFILILALLSAEWIARKRKGL